MANSETGVKSFTAIDNDVRLLTGESNRLLGPEGEDGDISTVQNHEEAVQRA